MVIFVFRIYSKESIINILSNSNKAIKMCLILFIKGLSDTMKNVFISYESL